MSKKSNKNRIIYSTNPNYSYEEEEEMDTLPPREQTLEVHLEKKNRAGKAAVVIKGFIGLEEDLKQLGKELKAACGVGGSTKNGNIIIQGDDRVKVMDLLKRKGYQVKRVGG